MSLYGTALGAALSMYHFAVSSDELRMCSSSRAVSSTELSTQNLYYLQYWIKLFI